MRTKPRSLDFSALPQDYAGLCQLLPPRPIHDAVDFRNVAEITDAMAGHTLTADQADYFDLLCRLIEDWEQPQLAVPKATGLETLRSLLEAHRMSASDLSKLLGVHRTLGPMILRGERNLTLQHVKTLAKHFAVSTDAFID